MFPKDQEGAPGLLVTYRPADHRIYDTEFASHIQRNLRRKDLFTYRHQRTGRWMVARWVDPRKGWFEELLGVNNLGDFSRAHVQWLKQWHNGTTMDLTTFRRMLAEQERDADREHWDNLAEVGEIKRSIGRSLGSDDPEWQRAGGFMCG